MATQTEMSDRELAEQVEGAETAGKSPSKGLLQKVRNRLQDRAERHGVELPDGSFVTGATAKLLRENEGAEYIGSELRVVVRVRGAQGLERTELWNPRQQSAAEIVPGSKRTEMLEYVRIPGTIVTVPPSGDARDKTPVGKRSPDKVFMVKNGDTPVCIGQRISLACLQRLDARGVLSAAGEKLLRELMGDENEHGTEEQPS